MSTKEELTTNGQKIFQNKLIILLAGVFFLDLVIMLIVEGRLKFVYKEVRLAFILLPPIIFLTKNKLAKIRDLVLLSTVFGILIYIAYADIYLIYFYNQVANVEFALDHFLKYNYTNIPGAYHHSYQGLYMLFSIMILLDNSITSKKIRKEVSRFLVAIIFVHMIFMAGKLTLMLALIFIALSALKPYFWKSKLKLWAVGASIVLMTVMVIFLNMNKLFDTIAFSFSNRINSWTCSMRLFFENPILGTDEATIMKSLNACVESNAISTHNQYLNELLDYGIFALWLPVFYFLIFLRSKNNGLLRNLLYMIIILSLFENVFSLQRGVLFIIFYFSLLYFCPLKNNIQLE
ncbi:MULTISPECIES: O-antigen ligase family protein [Flagellimonas]|uniref:O-antigen ligase family protein n=1 Tax=Flagellimonas TaxID=444459 RepID=UPI0018659E47|nr:O-antigen ligase family protein [Allomuricauda hadalis]